MIARWAGVDIGRQADASRTRVRDGLTVIDVRQLTKHYGKTVAVDGLTFGVEPGRVTGFLGPNGAGKSTTMRMMLGLDRPLRGEALRNGTRRDGSAVDDGYFPLAGMRQPVVVAAYEHGVVQLGLATVRPLANMVALRPLRGAVAPPVGR